MKRSSELKTTLQDYILLLNKYNANSEFFNGKIRNLMSENSRLSLGFAICLILLGFSIAFNIYFLIVY